MKFTAKITRNGQITLPKKLRIKNNIEEGQIILFSEEENKIILQPIPMKHQETDDHLKVLESGLQDWADPIHDDLFEIEQ